MPPVAVGGEARHLRNWGDTFLVVLGLTLAGYALLGRTFAYLGVQPLLVGELTLIAGLVTYARSGAMLASVVTLPMQLLVVMMAWVLLRTIPFIPEFGFDALRDSVIVMYGLLALIVAAVIIEEDRRLARALELYRRFVEVGIPVMIVLGLIASVFASKMPDVVRPGVPLLQMRAGDFGAHLAGAAIFVLLGLARATPAWLAALLLAICLAASANRGAMIAIAIPVGIAAILSGRWRPLAVGVSVALVALSIAYVFDLEISDIGETPRTLSARQLIENISSLFGGSANYLEGTKEWRLAWWNAITTYTLHGDYFWTGKGFGIGLAEADGFMVGNNPDAPPLRSPHSAHMTMLARGGVPGLALWAGTLLAWSLMLASSYVRARQLRHETWASVFLFIGCYQLANLITASVDVALESPILGFWFWSLFGLGVAAVMIFRFKQAGDWPSPPSAPMQGAAGQ